MTRCLCTLERLQALGQGRLLSPLSPGNGDFGPERLEGTQPSDGFAQGEIGGSSCSAAQQSKSLGR